MRLLVNTGTEAIIVWKSNRVIQNFKGTRELPLVVKARLIEYQPKEKYGKKAWMVMFIDLGPTVLTQTQNLT